MSTTIHADRLLAHPPSAVWRALTDPALLSRWLMPTDFQPVLGARFSFDTGRWGKAECEVLEIVPERRLTISWRNGGLDTTVTWRLEPEGDGTRLYTDHAGFNLEDPLQRFAYEGMKGGWTGAVTDRLEALLHEG